MEWINLMAALLAYAVCVYGVADTIIYGHLMRNVILALAFLWLASSSWWLASAIVWILQ